MQVARAPILVTWASVLTVVFASGAAAQVWTDPTSRYSLDFARLGWESEPPQEGYYLAVVSSTARAQEKFLQCEARILGPIPGSAHADQARANVASTAFGVENLVRVFPDARDPRVDHTNVDGVAVVDLRFTTPGQGGLHHHWRIFHLATAQGVVQHQIQCGGALPTTPAYDAEIDAVLGTLRFNPAE